MPVCLVHISGNFSEVHIARICLVIFKKTEKTDVVCALICHFKDILSVVEFNGAVSCFN